MLLDKLTWTWEIFKLNWKERKIRSSFCIL